MTPAIGAIIDAHNADDALLPIGAIVVDNAGDAWQRYHDVWRCVPHHAAPSELRFTEMVDTFGPVEVAWLPPDIPTPYLQAALERRAA